MKTLKKILLSCVAIAGFAGFTACNDNNNSTDNSGTSRLKISMTDAPGDYDEVNVEVIDVKIKNSDDEGEGGWVSVGNISPGVYNLLDLTGGVTVTLADNEVPSGNLRQIRLILGDDNTVVKDGITYPLHTPSAQQSGLKIHLNQTLEPDMVYNLLVDFDVHNSVVVQAGNSGNFNLHPVLHVTAEAASGSISGTVSQPEVQFMASVTVGDQAVTAYTDDLGVFVLHGLPEGVYSVTLTADAESGIAPITIENVTVTNGEITNLGTISI